MAKNENDIDQEWSKEFRDYTEMIVKHPNYKGLYFERDDDNDQVKWVVTGKSEKGQKRLAWWNNKCKELGIKIESGCYAKAARAIHPTGYHVCQCCGKKLSIEYEYPGNSLLKKINSILHTDFEQSDYTIKDIIEKFVKTQDQLSYFADIFKYSGFDKKGLINHIYKDYVRKQSKRLSPGVMSNCPDRFDGFHSYGLCCRKKQDKGRHDDNMYKYSQDRRAYEEWADGDINLANKFMDEYRKDDKLYKCPRCHKLDKMSADHIGPISLGFCHSIYNFQPLCSSCNSAKNNRFYFDDVKKLIELEKEGHQVISWHSCYAWNSLKYKVKNDIDAKLLSKVLLTCHQNVLKLFALIYKETGENFLRTYLHPENYPYNYDFKNFDPFNVRGITIIKKPIDSKNKKKQQERSIRIAFESLDGFDDKDNRNTKFYLDYFRLAISRLISTIKTGDFNKSDRGLRTIIEDIQKKIIKEEWTK